MEMILTEPEEYILNEYGVRLGEYIDFQRLRNDVEKCLSEIVRLYGLDSVEEALGYINMRIVRTVLYAAPLLLMEQGWDTGKTYQRFIEVMEEDHRNPDNFVNERHQILSRKVFEIVEKPLIQDALKLYDAIQRIFNVRLGTDAWLELYVFLSEALGPYLGRINAEILQKLNLGQGQYR